MDTKKKLLRHDRVRRLPKEGWSWIDRRFLREKAPELDHDSILLYFFLASVADKHGLSFFSGVAIAGRLRMSEVALERAREELLGQDLIAYEKPLYQVLSIPEAVSPPLGRSCEPCEPTLIRELFREIAGRVATDNSRSPRHGDSR